MAEQLTGDVAWLNECFVHGSAHEHVSVYLIEHADESIVIDTGSFWHRDGILADIDALTDGAGPDAIILSHSDYPHAGNVGAIEARWGDVEVVASSGSPEQQGLAGARSVSLDTCEFVSGREFSFIDPPLADRSHTTWIFDHIDGILFTADGFGNYHQPGECAWTSVDFGDGIAADTIFQFHRDTLPWLRFVDPPALRRALMAVFAERDVQWIAPVHGNPIRGDAIETYLDRLVGELPRISFGDR